MPKKKSIFAGGVAFSTPIKIENKTVVLTFPEKVLKYLNTNGATELFWYPTNGVIQLSASGPSMVIPLMTINQSNFVPQPTL